ncbi:MAG: DUF4178 domain-containing protein [Pseudomonadota bacterium]
MQDGSTKPLAGGVKTFSCPNCGGSIDVRAVGISISALCSSCGSLIDIANENLKIITKAAVNVEKSVIPLGTRAVLFDVEWEAIGYCVRSDESGQYHWREYLLFNPYQGFRFLTEADGHWNFVRMLRRHVRGEGVADAVTFDNRKYRVYLRGGARVDYVMGEFYWRARVGETSRVVDSISPPLMLSMEEGQGDIVWSQAIYMHADDIKDAFKLKHIPQPIGIAPNQPSPHAKRTKGLRKLTCLLIGLLVVLQLALSASAAKTLLYQRSVVAEPIYKGQVVISDLIEIPPGTRNVAIYAQSPVDNSWVELETSLVNDATDKSSDTILPIEYYHGHDSDGAWSEGGQAKERILDAVPGGAYHLQVVPDAQAFNNNGLMRFDMRILRDVPDWENFWWALVLLLGYPGFAFWRHSRFEAKRWSNSDQAPMAYRYDVEGDSDTGGKKMPLWGWAALFILWIVWSVFL